ncbi:MAG: TRAP transporter small permease [Eubacteriales bacterium]|nr:TRAP transporter small permease [Eubacteriales bacterium]
MEMIKKNKFNLLNKLEESIAKVFMLILLTNIFLQVVTRLLGFPLSFTEEISRFSYIWITFIGIPYTIHADINIRFTLVIGRLTGKFRYVFEMLLRILEFALMSFLLYWSIRYCSFMAGVRSPALEISVLWVYACLPIGFALAIVRLVQSSIKNIRIFKCDRSGGGV